MHRSRLSNFVLDCQGHEVDEAAGFWAAALGRTVKPADPADPGYRELIHRDGGVQLLLQRVDHPGRIHLDIESDDLEAEVRRLEALGAHRVGFVKDWWVMEAPTGQRFCVVHPERSPLEGQPGVTTWE